MSRAIVIRLVQRVAKGGARKSVKALRGGVFEIKTVHGPGYRVYGVSIKVLVRAPWPESAADCAPSCAQGKRSMPGCPHVLDSFSPENILQSRL